MGWERRWRILADVITDLRRSGGDVPLSVINDLRSAKTMIEIVKADRSRPENISRLEEYLSNVEAYVLSAAKERFGENYVNDVLRRICEVEFEETAVEPQVRFRPGLPREERWIRVQVADDVPLEVIREIAGECGLKCRVEEDGYVLVYGGDEGVKSFVKRMAEVVRETRGR